MFGRQGGLKERPVSACQLMLTVQSRYTRSGDACLGQYRRWPGYASDKDSCQLHQTITDPGTTLYCRSRSPTRYLRSPTSAAKRARGGRGEKPVLPLFPTHDENIPTQGASVCVAAPNRQYQLRSNAEWLASLRPLPDRFCCAFTIRPLLWGPPVSLCTFVLLKSGCY